MSSNDEIQKKEQQFKRRTPSKLSMASSTALMGNQRKNSPATPVRKSTKLVEVTLSSPGSVNRSRSMATSTGTSSRTSQLKRLPAFAAPAAPSMEQLIGERFMLDKSEHNLILNSLKKFSNANKQLLAVSRPVYEKLSTLHLSPKVEVMNAQLEVTRDDLSKVNAGFIESITDASQRVSHLETIKVAHEAIIVASDTSNICAAMKAVTIELKGETSIFRSVLTSITTARDSIILLVDTFGKITDKLDKSLISELSTYIKKLDGFVNSLVSSLSGPIITLGRKLEIEAAIRAATCSVVKLINSFNRPIDQSIVNETKVTGCCMSQLWATLNEISSSPALASSRELKNQIQAFLSGIKKNMADFMECTQTQVSNPTPESYDIMKISAKPLKSLLYDIVVTINRLAKMEPGSEEDVPVTDDMEKRAESITADPEDLIPPPPSVKQKQSFDLPDDFVEDVENIWEEPSSDKGRLLYTDTGTIRCATLNKLLIHLTGALDMTYMKTFITTYRSFTTPEKLLSKTVQLYHVPEDIEEKKKLSIQLRCSNLLKQWVDTSFADFDEDILLKLNEFLEELSKNPNYSKFSTKIQKTIREKCAEKLNGANEIVNLSIEEKVPLTPANLLFIISEEEIARQITLVDFSIYRAIQPAELLNQAWSKEKYRYRAKNVLNLISRSTLMARWVSSVIVWQETLKARVKALTKFINIAEHLLKLNNFNSLMAILAGINTSAVYRLKWTEKGLSQKTRTTFEELSNLMDACQSYSTYRAALHDADPPCVPFLGTYLTDITFIEDGNPDYSHGLINYRKRELVYTVIQEIQQYQQKAYSFELMDGIAFYLTELPNNDEETLYTLSLEREPRNVKSADELL